MTSYQFFLQYARDELPDAWPNWTVVAECGSSWHFTREDADKQLAHCLENEVKARIFKAEFV